MKKDYLTIIALFFIVVIAIFGGIFIGNKNAREWANKKLFKNSVSESELTKISIDENDKLSCYAYGNYIATLSNNSLKIYNNSGSQVTEINVQVQNPKFESKKNYLLLADEGGSNLYLIYNTSLQWKKEIEGSISQITINDNGAVGVAISGTTYKTVIAMYDITGSEEFKTYLSTNVASDLTISPDNRYLSFAETDSTGTVIKTIIKTIQVDKAKSSPDEAIVAKYENTNHLLLNIEYNNNRLTAFYDNCIKTLSKNEDKTILEINDKISFTDITIENYVCCINEYSESVLNNKYALQFINTKNQKINTYEIENSVKKLYSDYNVACLDMGNEIRIVNTKGWLVKTITTEQQSTKDILIGNSVIGIVYKDRIEIVKI